MEPCQTIPGFHVRDLDAAVRHYVDVLGFELVFRWGEPPFYAGVRLQGLTIHLNASPSAAERTGKGDAYIMVAGGVDAYHARIVARGARIVGDPPRRQDYGLKDFRLADPDGNWLSFGEECP